MVFSTIAFLLYFLPVFLATYYFTPKRYKNIVLLIFSIFFYSWGAPKFIFVILGSTFIDFHLVRWMAHIQTKLHRRLMLTLSVSINMGLLFYFKYSNFFIENVNVALTAFNIGEIHWVKLVLPIGISFYTFETITYVVDVYRGIHKPLHRFWDYQLYIILFPKLIAGPIIRYHELADQITDRSHNDSMDLRLTGFYRFVIGLGKKVLIANQMGLQADTIFAMPYSDLSTPLAWTGIVAYTFQIYFDFSGYSDMAIGLGRMLGFRFPENFNNPYISQSISEFWRRWHMTLGSWMRNYLYIPLGGNRVSPKRLYFNLWLVFLASGLWHGASWNFVIWGAFHGVLLVLERSFLLKIYSKTGKLPATLITFLLVMVGWVFFRVEQFDDAITYLQRMFSLNMVLPSLGAEFLFWLVIAVFFAFFTYSAKGEKIQNVLYATAHSNRMHTLLALGAIVLFVLSLSSISSFGFNPFIYFRF